MTSPRLAGKLGRLPNAGRPRVSLRPGHVPPAYTPPATLDRYSAVPPESWGMDGNDRVGDCTCADIDHEIKAVEVAAGNSEVTSTADEVLAAYSAITGYDPDDPNSDQGAEMQSVREYWQHTGFTLAGKPHTILMFADLPVSSPDTVRWALDQLGAVGLGIQVPASAQQQFGAGQPWTVVEGSPIEGGHAIALVGYDADYWYVLTWGGVQKMAPDFFARYVDEAWVALDAEFVNAHTGTDFLGGTLHDLGEQFAQITGKPNPVPAPAGPTPNAAAESLLSRFAAAVAHDVRAVEAWLTEHGF